MTSHPFHSSPHIAGRYATQAGVTLVELSIVLVILALLVGGVVSGISLLKGAEVRSVISEYQRYQMGVSNFQTTYGGLPGDLTDAADVWGMAPNAGSPAASDAACASLNKNSPSQGTRTCNGDGDGTISVGYEEFRAWQQLANANLIDGTYTGVGGSATAGVGFQSGINCPKSSFRDGCWRVFYRDSNSTQLAPFALFEGNYESHLFSQWGGALTASDFTPTFTPAEMWEIDNKVDNGLPATGSVIAPHGGGNAFDDCTRTSGGGSTSYSDTNAHYNTDAKSRSCQLFMKANF